MSKKIERKDRHFKFETLQLHVGQELSLIHIYTGSNYQTFEFEGRTADSSHRYGWIYP